MYILYFHPAFIEMITVAYSFT